MILFYEDLIWDCCNWGEREMRLNSEFSQDSWGFIANEQSEGVNGWKITEIHHLF